MTTAQNFSKGLLAERKIKKYIDLYLLILVTLSESTFFLHRRVFLDKSRVNLRRIGCR